jgi:hypothetical protein
MKHEATGTAGSPDASRAAGGLRPSDDAGFACVLPSA